MKHDNINTLITMANQISENLNAHLSDEDTAKQVCAHLKSFWARSMKRDIIQYSHQVDNKLAPIVKVAVQQLEVLYPDYTNA